MDDIENLHQIQRNILTELLFTKQARFSEIRDKEIESDHFNFHLKRLLELGLVEKNIQKRYRLTTKGKEYANRFDTQEAIIEKQAKVAVLIVAIKKDSGKEKYLIQKRLKQPYYGYHGFITGKVSLGETLIKAAERELMEETGLSGKLQIKGVKHKIDYSKEGELLEDKFFFVYEALELEGQLKEIFRGGKNVWLTRDEIFKLEKLFDGVKKSLDLAAEEELVIREDKYKVDEF